MFKVNEYYEGNIKSIAFNTTDAPATIGVIAAGEYEFGTSTIEYMTIISGEMAVLLPSETQWKSFHPFDTFIVLKNTRFKIKVTSDTSYLCLYK